MPTERDINDAFDDIVMSEETLFNEGYQDGAKAGKVIAYNQGYHTGHHKGYEIGAELGYYCSFLCFHLSKSESNKVYYTEKIVKELTKVKEAIDNFPKTISEGTDIISTLESIRCNFKKICSLLKIHNDYAVTEQVSF